MELRTIINDLLYITKSITETAERTKKALFDRKRDDDERLPTKKVIKIYEEEKVKLQSLLDNAIQANEDLNEQEDHLIKNNPNSLDDPIIKIINELKNIALMQEDLIRDDLEKINTCLTDDRSKTRIYYHYQETSILNASILSESLKILASINSEAETATEQNKKIVELLKISAEKLKKTQEEFAVLKNEYEELEKSTPELGATEEQITQELTKKDEKLREKYCDFLRQSTAFIVLIRVSPYARLFQIIQKTAKKMGKKISNYLENEGFVISKEGKEDELQDIPEEYDDKHYTKKQKIILCTLKILRCLYANSKKTLAFFFTITSIPSLVQSIKKIIKIVNNKQWNNKKEILKLIGLCIYPIICFVIYILSFTISFYFTRYIMQKIFDVEDDTPSAGKMSELNELIEDIEQKLEEAEIMNTAERIPGELIRELEGYYDIINKVSIVKRYEEENRHEEEKEEEEKEEITSSIEEAVTMKAIKSIEIVETEYGAEHGCIALL